LLIEKDDVKKAVLYDTGRFPIWVRIPAALFAGLMGILAVRLVLRILNLPGGLAGEGSLGGTIVAIVGLLAIGWMYGFLWFGQVRVVFDGDSQDVVVRKRGYWRWFEKHYSLRDAERLQLHQVRTGFCSRRWVLNTRFLGGRVEEIELLPEADKVANCIGRAASLPVVQAREG
jgi:hypothetical protein